MGNWDKRGMTNCIIYIKSIQFMVCPQTVGFCAAKMKE